MLFVSLALCFLDADKGSVSSHTPYLHMLIYLQSVRFSAVIYDQFRFAYIFFLSA